MSVLKQIKQWFERTSVQLNSLAAYHAVGLLDNFVIFAVLHVFWNQWNRYYKFWFFLFIAFGFFHFQSHFSNNRWLACSFGGRWCYFRKPVQLSYVITYFFDCQKWSLRNLRNFSWSCFNLHWVSWGRGWLLTFA